MSKPNNWHEVWSRRSRLRSSSQRTRPNPEIVPVVALDDDDDDGEIGVIPEPLPAAVHNAGGKSPQKQQGECGNNDDADPSYFVFLNHLEPDGKSYRLKVTPLNSGSPLFLKYEEEEDDGDPHINATPSATADSIRAKSPVLTKQNVANIRKKRCEANLVDEDYLYFLNHSREYDRPLVSEVDNNATVDYVEEDDAAGKVDEDYRFFLNHAKEHAGSVILKLDNGVTVIYEKDDYDRMQDENLSEELDVRPKVPKDDSYLFDTKMALLPCSCSHRPPNYSEYEVNGCSLETEGCTSPSLYAQRLKIFLAKPFDQSEYDWRMLEASTRRHITKHQEFRSTNKSITIPIPGRSYLDHYPELDEMLKYADHRAQLNLLRGFFFWLENVAQEGSFKPWEHTSSSYEMLSSSGRNLMLPIQIEGLEN